MKLPLSRIAEFVSATGEFDHKAVAQAYSIDSRTIQPGQPYTSGAAGGNFGAFTQTISNTVGSGTNRQFQLALRFGF